jgi:hypothetical protein
MRGLEKLRWAKAQQSCRFPAPGPLDAGGLGLRSPAAYACRASGSSGASRTSVSTISVTATGRSITSTAAVSTTEATGCFTFRAAFFTGARLGLVFATERFVAFAALDTLRSLPRLAGVPFRSTFDAFLRLAMIATLVLRNDTTGQFAAAIKRELSTDRSLSAQRPPVFFLGRTGGVLL